MAKQGVPLSYSAERQFDIHPLIEASFVGVIGHCEASLLFKTVESILRRQAIC